MNVDNIRSGSLVAKDEQFISELFGCINNLSEDLEPDSTHNGCAGDIDQDHQSKVRFIIKNIETHAFNKRFLRAEKLRTKLYEFAPKAIREIYDAGKLIEKEKSKLHYDRLKQVLSDGEYTAIKGCLVNHTYRADTIIVSKGEATACLYFINEGAVMMKPSSGIAGKDSVAARQGCVAGAESFFSLSPSGLNLIAQAGTNVDCLAGEDFSKLIESYPEIKEKLYRFCIHSTGNIKPAVKKPEKENRQHERYTISGTTKTQLMNSSMKPTGKPIAGDLINLSRGGLAFRYVTDHMDPVSMFVGKTANVVLEPTGLKLNQAMTWDGTIVAVRKTGRNEYTIHFKGAVINKPIINLLSFLKKRFANRKGMNRLTA